MIFGERIKQLRTEKQWTQEYVCEKLNISAGALSRYETSMYEPKSLELVRDFANLFNVSTDYLLGKSDIRNPEKIQLSDIELTQDDIDFIKKVKPLSEQNKKFLEKMIETFDDISNK